MIKTKIDYLYYHMQDKKVNNILINSFFDRIKYILFPNKIWVFLKLLRKVEYYNNKKKTFFDFILLYIYMLKLRNIQYKLGFSIPINVFGPGLSIPHYGTIVVNPNAKIGAYCRLHAGVNIGASTGSKKAPLIGDNCYIGPGAIIFGNINIANNVTIGANATVNKSCDINNVVLAGTPAKIVKENSPTWLDFNEVDI